MQISTFYFQAKGYGHSARISFCRQKVFSIEEWAEVSHAFNNFDSLLLQVAYATVLSIRYAFDAVIRIVTVIDA